MDKNFINENGLNEAVEHFKYLAEYEHPKQSLKNLYEYTVVTNGMVNEEGEDDVPPQNGGNMPQDGGNMPQDGGNMPQDGGNMPQDGGNMPQDGGNVPQDGGEMPQDGGNVPQDGGEMPQDGGEIDLGFPSEGEEGIETEEMEPDDEVIDVDDLTQSQEATEYKIDGVDDRLSLLYAAVQKFADQLDKNAESIESLKAEFERRNPTQEERLNIRSQSSYPYCETPKNYWEEKTKENPHYNVMYNNDVAPSEEQEKFNITRDDINGVDMKSVSDTLNVDQDLKKYIGF